MTDAIINASSIVRSNGYLVLALYNRHWSSKPWWLIKYLYVKSPKFIQKIFTWLLFPVIWFAKLLVTGKNPMNKLRGMNFYYDVIDWVGGYPYEYETVSETIERMKGLGFECIKSIHANVPTGCNEFLFRKFG